MKTFRSILKALCLVSAAALLGIPGLSSAQQYLYSIPLGKTWRDNYTGGSGCLFTVGSSNVVVSHLGYFSTNTATGLQISHPVGVYDSSVHLLGQVTVPAGKSAYFTASPSFYWMQLDPPLLLSSNTTYYVATLPQSGDGDWWGDSTAPAGWNAYFVGTQATTTRQTAYAPGGTTWPVTSFSTFGNNTTYLLEGLGNIPQGPAKVDVTTNLVVATTTNQTLSVLGFASGAATISYQWWQAPGTRLPYQTNATLYLTNATSGTYYLTASNSLGGEQSANVVVAVSPVVLGQLPQVTANPIPLFSGANPTFSLSSVVGIQPFSYQWTTNGVPVSGATNVSYTLTNAQASGPTHIACVVTNIAGMTTSLVWNLSFVARPTAPYQAAVLADQPIGYWPLNEADSGGGNNGVVANEYLGARDGVYTNTVLAQSGYAQGLASQYNYNPATDLETSALFGSYPGNPSVNNMAGSIQGVNLATPTNTSGNFSIEVWARGDAQSYNAGIVAKGAWAAEQFTLDTGGNNYSYRFTTRDAGGTLRTVSSNTNLPDGNWHHLVGVLDQSHSNLCMYVDGLNVAITGCSPSNGVLSTTVPLSIGCRLGSGGAYNQQFFGNINDVAIYSYALSSNQVMAHYLAAGIGPSFLVQPPSVTNVNEGTALVVPAQAIGSLPLSYQWTDVTGGTPGPAIPGQTNATLDINNISAAAWNGHILAVTASNHYGQATSQSMSVNVQAGPPTSVAIAPSSMTVYAGMPVVFTATAQGTQPFSYQWAVDGNSVAGATASTYTNLAPADAHTIACSVTNSQGPGSPLPATASLTGVTRPTDNYAVHVLNDQPLAFWRLDETANASTANDYVGGHNAAYNNVVNEVPGFSPENPDTATAFGTNGVVSDSVAVESDNSASGIPNIDFSTQGTNVHFSLEAWIAAPPGQKNGAALLCKGYGNGGEQFCLDVFNNGYYRFYIRNANNTFVRSAQSTNAGPDGNWHHLAAVCDQAHGSLYLYVDGALNATGTTVPGEGIQGPLPSTGPVLTSIGSGMTSPTDLYSYQLTNAVMDEVAIYNYALSSNQVAAHYSAAGESPLILTDLEPDYLWGASFPLSLSVVADGSPPLVYQWQKNGTNLSDGGAVSGSHASTLLLNPAAVADSGSYRLIITNQSGAATSTVAAVTVQSRLGFNDLGTGWSLNGGAQFTFTDEIELTDGTTGESRSSFFSFPAYIGGFRASFTYQDFGGGGADGMALVFQNDSRGAGARGGGGGGLGYNGITNSAALEFNIYSPNGVGFAFRTNGVTGQPYAGTGPVNLASGDDILVSLTYLTGTMSMSLTDQFTGVFFTTNFSANIPFAVGGSSAYVGFTGGCGSVAALQYVSDFTFVGLVGLTVQPSVNNSVTLSWPAGAGGYLLQQSPAVRPASWTNVTTPALPGGQGYQVVLPASAGHTFFRLVNSP
jgi:hypothetical protein